MAIESSSGNGIGNTLNYGKWGVSRRNRKEFFKKYFL
jgi:hypothetical protein